MFGGQEVMAATPTEVLNDDIKELKSEIRENRTKIDLVKDEVQRIAVAQAEMKVELRDDMHKIALSQAEMKGEFRMVKLLLSMVLAGIAGSAWQFYGLNARVNTIETKVNAIEPRLDRLESLGAKILEQTKPAVPARISLTTP
jgi:outer membrane murein-binding lipoprotein Lpp